MPLFSIFHLPIGLAQYNGRNSWLRINQRASVYLASNQGLKAFDTPPILNVHAWHMINKTDSQSCAVSLIDLCLIFPDAVLVMLKSGDQ
jgi:hypothetical protein